MQETDKLSKKERIQYITSIGFLITGIILCYLSFFLNEYNIENGVLFYLGTATTFCGAVFGINVFIHNQVIQAETRLNDRIDKRIREEEFRIKENNIEEEL